MLKEENKKRGIQLITSSFPLWKKNPLYNIYKDFTTITNQKKRRGFISPSSFLPSEFPS